MAVVPKKRKKFTTYYVVLEWEGHQDWEPAGREEREAERLERRRKTEMANGTYVPMKARSGRGRVGTYVKRCKDEQILLNQKAPKEAKRFRNAKAELGRLEMHLFDKRWFCEMTLEDVKPPHALRLYREWEMTVLDTGKPMAPKSVANLFGIVHGCFQRAVYEGILVANPCVLPPGTISTKVVVPRYPYTLEEVHRLTSDPVPWDQLVLNALRFYAGLREGEACGRRFLHWDRAPKPLGALLVNTQFDDLPLKTSNHQRDRVRMVPVHPELERILDAWWNVHFEEVYGRKPRVGDFIVPRRLGRHTKNTETNHTNSTAGKAFNATCLLVGIQPHTEHASRHTMISINRNNGAPDDVLEKITHNKKGTIIDAYTTWQWEPLCKAVMAFPMRNGKPALQPVEDPGQLALHAKLDAVLKVLGGHEISAEISALSKTPQIYGENECRRRESNP